VGHWPERQVPDDESGGNYGKDARRRISAQNQRCPQLARRAEAKGAGRLIKGAIAAF